MVDMAHDRHDRRAQGERSALVLTYLRARKDVKCGLLVGDGHAVVLGRHQRRVVKLEQAIRPHIVKADLLHAKLQLACL